MDTHRLTARRQSERAPPQITVGIVPQRISDQPLGGNRPPRAPEPDDL
jgi:hypothetical protein